MHLLDLSKFHLLREMMKALKLSPRSSFPNHVLIKGYFVFLHYDSKLLVCHPPLPHHAGRSVAVGVHMDDGQGAVGGGAGPEDGVGDQVVTPQAHRHTPV